MKSIGNAQSPLARLVAPCAGAWIEMVWRTASPAQGAVAPCAGAWIEILYAVIILCFTEVAPCAGAWIEMALPKMAYEQLGGRPLRGGVD